MNIILSIKPEFVKDIIAQSKRYEFRKATFKQPVEKIYIYASAPISKVIGEFQPVAVVQGTPEQVWDQTKDYAGITKQWYDLYYQGHSTAYAIKINNLKIYNTPKALPFHAPQNFRYIKQL